MYRRLASVEHLLKNKKILPGILLVFVCTLISLIHFNFDWIPHDEGLIHGCAERVSNKELAHVDFYAQYTGFLYYYTNFLHKLFGNNILSGRYPLILLNIGIVMIVFSIGSKLFKDLAFLAGLACSVWGMNNYFAPLPSWYCLFFGLLSLYFLIIPYQEKNNIHYLCISGAFAGIVFLFKQSIGIYNLLAILSYVCIEYLTSYNNDSISTKLLRFLCYAYFTVVLFFIINLTFKTEPIWFCSFLSLFYAIFIILSLRMKKQGLEETRISFIFVKKTVLVVIAFILVGLPYYCLFTKGSDMIIFLKNISCLKSIYSKFLNMPVYSDIAIPTIVLICLIFLSISLRLFKKISISTRLLMSAIVLSVYVAIVIYIGGEIGLFKIFWDMVVLFPIGVLFYCIITLLNNNRPVRLCVNREFKTFAAVTLFAFFFFLLIVPYGYALYYLYFTPFFVILFLYMFFGYKNKGGLFSLKSAKIVLVIFIIAGMYFNEKYRILMGGATKRPSKMHDYELLDLPRGGIFVPRIQKNIYKQIHDIVNYYAPADDFIFAFSDCSEVYYLCQKRNPCWHAYADLTSGVESYGEIMNKLVEHKVNLVVFNSTPEIYIESNERNKFADKLLELYPLKYKVGNFFIGIRDSKTIKT